MILFLSTFFSFFSDEKTVTHEGFQFLLSDIPNQVWTLVQSYIDQLASGSEKTDAVSFLIFLATLPTGKVRFVHYSR